MREASPGGGRRSGERPRGEAWCAIVAEMCDATVSCPGSSGIGRRGREIASGVIAKVSEHRRGVGGQSRSCPTQVLSWRVIFPMGPIRRDSGLNIRHRRPASPRHHRPRASPAATTHCQPDHDGMRGSAPFQGAGEQHRRDRCDHAEAGGRHFLSGGYSKPLAHPEKLDCADRAIKHNDQI